MTRTFRQKNACTVQRKLEPKSVDFPPNLGSDVLRCDSGRFVTKESRLNWKSSQNPFDKRFLIELGRGSGITGDRAFLPLEADLELPRKQLFSVRSGL